jgi:hypothetical protein
MATLLVIGQWCRQSHLFANGSSSEHAAETASVERTCNIDAAEAEQDRRQATGQMKITCTPAPGAPFAASSRQRLSDTAPRRFGHLVHAIGPLDGRPGRILPYGPISVAEIPASKDAIRLTVPRTRSHLIGTRELTRKSSHELAAQSRSDTVSFSAARPSALIATMTNTVVNKRNAADRFISILFESANECESPWCALSKMKR